MPVVRSLVEQLQEFESALITEAMGAMGCPNPEAYYVGRDVKLLTTMNEPLAGVALTMTCDTSTPGLTPDASGLWESYALMQKSPVPTVVIMKAVGLRPLHEAVLGDGMAKMMKSFGACGMVSDGGARDIERINRVGFTVFAAGTVSNHVPPIYRVSREPVELSGVSFRTGDLVFGDRDGVIVVPERYHPGIVEACILSRDAETRVHTFWRRTDKTIAEKREFVTSFYAAHYARCRALMISDR